MAMLSKVRSTLAFSLTALATAIHPGVCPAQERTPQLTPEIVLKSWQEWARRFESQAWEGEIREEYLDRREIVAGQGSGESEARRQGTEEDSPPELRAIEGTVRLYFLTRWPEVLWEMTGVETVKRPGQAPTRSVVRKGVLVRDGTAIVLSGSDAGWVIRRVTSIYAPDDPPTLWNSLERLHEYYAVFQFLLNAHGLRRWATVLPSGQLQFDSIRRVDDGLEVAWHINLDGLPRSQAIDLMPYSRGRWVLDPQNAWLPVTGETTGRLVDGAPSRVVFRARYQEYAGVPLDVERDTETVFGPDDSHLTWRISGKQWLTIHKVSPTLDRSKLTLAHFGLPDDIRVGPPAGGVPRWQRLLAAAMALLICGAVLAWWLRRRKPA